MFINTSKNDSNDKKNQKNQNNQTNYFQMNKINAGEYNIHFYLENNNIQLDNIIDFHLIKLLYELNQDIYEKIDLKIVNDNEATLLAISKHLFQDLGITQKYTHLKITKTIQDTNKIVFDLQTVKTSQSEDSTMYLIPQKAELLPIEHFIIVCNVINKHKIDITIDFKIDTDTIELPVFVESALCKIFIKMFKRVKQFIENIR
jgi:hypothetical protein